MIFSYCLIVCEDYKEFASNKVGVDANKYKAASYYIQRSQVCWLPVV